MALSRPRKEHVTEDGEDYLSSSTSRSSMVERPRLRRQLEAALLRPQADGLYHERGVEEKRDGRDASDVGGVAAREGAHEELRGEVEEAGGRRRFWRGGGGGGGGEAARAAARRGGHREKKNSKTPRTTLGMGHTTGVF